MKLPNYILFSINEGQHILSTTKPFSIGQLWKCKGEQELSLKMEEFRTNGKTVTPVEGYTIFVMWDGALLPESVIYSIEEETELMAAFYSQHIQSKPRAYARYEIKPFKPYKPLFTHTEIQVL